MRRPLAALALAVTIATATAAAADRAALPTWTVTADQGGFTPDRISVPAGQRVKLVLRNRGGTPLEFENPTLHVEKVLAPRSESFVVMTLPAGTHAFIDEFRFVRGTLTVVAE